MRAEEEVSISFLERCSLRVVLGSLDYVETAKFFSSCGINTTVDIKFVQKVSVRTYIFVSRLNALI